MKPPCEGCEYNEGSECAAAACKLKDQQPMTEEAGLQPRADEACAGIVEQNQPATFDGQRGFWVQGDCVFIGTNELGTHPNPTAAIDAYRRKMSFGQIGVSHNLHCGSLVQATTIAAMKAEIEGIMHQIEREESAGIPPAGMTRIQQAKMIMNDVVRRFAWKDTKIKALEAELAKENTENERAKR